MRFIGGIINILFGVFVLALSYHSFGMHFGGNKKDVVKFTQLLNEGETTMAIFDSTYTELKIKSSTSYLCNYSFKVDGKTYKGEHTYKSIDDLISPVVEVRYLKSNPEINGLEIEKQLEKASKNSDSKFDLVLGIGALIVGAFLILAGIGRFRSKA